MKIDFIIEYMLYVNDDIEDVNSDNDYNNYNIMITQIYNDNHL